MSYIVYHESFLPELLQEEEQYLEYLSTGEWFDRPQIYQKGNRNETERLLDGFREKQRNQSGQYGLHEDGGEILQHSVHKERNSAQPANDGDCRSNESENTQVVKRRGRPKLNK